MKLRFDWLVFVAVMGTSAGSLAQIPFVPAQAPTPSASTTAQTPQQQADIKWLMSYMLANEGYRFDDVPMMERSFGKMSPTQLSTLRQFYEKKHALQMQHAATMVQLQAQQAVSAATAPQPQWPQRPQHQSFFLTRNQDAWPGSIANVRLENMSDIADANEKGYLFNVRPIPGFRNDPFGQTPMRAVGYGNWGERSNDLSPDAGAN